MYVHVQVEMKLKMFEVTVWDVNIRNGNSMNDTWIESNRWKDNGEKKTEAPTNSIGNMFPKSLLTGQMVRGRLK